MESSKPAVKIHSLDFIRAVCALGIIIFHTSCHTAPESPKILLTFAGHGNWGNVFVCVFLAISGGVLYHNYKTIPSLRQFYFKRWKSVLLVYYLFWFLRYLDFSVSVGNFFFNGNPLRILFSLLGMDGYLAYKFPTYYLLGDWFVGAILILYFLYPFLLKLVNRFGWKILFVYVPLLLWQVETDVFEIIASRNIIYCSFAFLLGMLIFKYELYTKKIPLLISSFIVLVLLFVPLPNLSLYAELLMGISLFIVLFHIGNYVMKIPVFGDIFSFLSRLSFPIFLVHHVVVINLINVFPSTTMRSVISIIALAIAISIFYAWCGNAIIHALTRTTWFKRLEHFFISDKSAKIKE